MHWLAILILEINNPQKFSNRICLLLLIRTCLWINFRPLNPIFHSRLIRVAHPEHRVPRLRVQTDRASANPAANRTASNLEDLATKNNLFVAQQQHHPTIYTAADTSLALQQLP